MDFKNFRNTREIILEILIRIEEKNAYLNILINYYLKNYNVKNIDKGFIHEICYGVTRFRKSLDWIIGQFLVNNRKKLPSTILNILRMGVYQIVYLDKVPDYAIVNESVQLAKKGRFSGYSNLVNAILRNIIRKYDNIYWPDINQDPVKYISVFYSYPDWMIKRWLKRYGMELCKTVCNQMNTKPNITLRINKLRINMVELKNKLDVNFREAEYLNNESIIVSDFFDVANSEMFKSGLFSVQDESSTLASRLLNPLPDQTIIDMCSGPGGKTTHMAQLMNNKGNIIAFEKNPRRLEMVMKECKRLGIDIVKPILNDATILRKNYLGKADKILVDVPCSGTGVIRKKPDLKWKILNDDSLKKLNKIQKAILNTASGYLKPGGELVYSTCSLEKEENDIIIRNFLKNNNHFIVKDTTAFVNDFKVVKFNTEIDNSIQLLPGYSGSSIDGFYMVKLQKNK